MYGMDLLIWFGDCGHSLNILTTSKVVTIETKSKHNSMERIQSDPNLTEPNRTD